MKSKPLLTIIIPAFNEEAVLPTTIPRLNTIENNLKADGQIDLGSNILIVDDGSSDLTWQIISHAQRQLMTVAGLKFSRNYGHQQALVAGLKAAVSTADIMVTIDADLQDDPDKIPEMVADFKRGADIVYGVRNNRQTDTWFKRTSAQAYYKLLNLIGVDLVPNHADFRLMSKRAVQSLLAFPERNLFLRGLVPMLGFKSDRVFYKRTPRQAGTSKYPLKKMLALAWNGITSLTIVPIRMILGLGILVCGLSLIIALYTIIAKASGLTVRGWSSMMISLWFFGGIQMISIGIIGEYLGKVMVEVKHRPRYLIAAYLPPKQSIVKRSDSHDLLAQKVGGFAQLPLNDRPLSRH